MKNRFVYYSVAAILILLFREFFPRIIPDFLLNNLDRDGRRFFIDFTNLFTILIYLYLLLIIIKLSKVPILFKAFPLVLLVYLISSKQDSFSMYALISENYVFTVTSSLVIVVIAYISIIKKAYKSKLDINAILENTLNFFAFITMFLFMYLLTTEFLNYRPRFIYEWLGSQKLALIYFYFSPIIFFILSIFPILKGTNNYRYYILQTFVIIYVLSGVILSQGGTSISTQRESMSMIFNSGLWLTLLLYIINSWYISKYHTNRI